MNDTPLQISQDSFSDILISLIGTPHEDQDCWGIIKTFYSRHGVILDEYYKERPSNQKGSEELILKFRDDFHKVEAPQYGDIILLNVAGTISHCAVYIGSGMMLHSMKNINCVAETMSRWNKRIEGFYRLKND